MPETQLVRMPPIRLRIGLRTRSVSLPGVSGRASGRPEDMPDRAPPSNRVLPGAARGPPQRVSGSVLRGVCPPDGSTRSLGRTVFRSAAGEPWRGWPSGMHFELPACVCPEWVEVAADAADPCPEPRVLANPCESLLRGGACVDGCVQWMSLNGRLFSTQRGVL